MANVLKLCFRFNMFLLCLYYLLRFNLFFIFIYSYGFVNYFYAIRP